MNGLQKKPVTGPALLVRQVRSGIGTKPIHRATLRALGLRGIGQENVLPDRPEIRGMLGRVPHLVTVTQSGAPESTARRSTPRSVTKEGA